MDRTKALRKSQVVVHTTAAMQVAWGMYERIRFERSPDLDFLQGALPVFGFRFRIGDGSPDERPAEQNGIRGTVLAACAELQRWQAALFGVPEPLIRQQYISRLRQRYFVGTVHLVFGPQGAGKSTYARRLAEESRAVRFSIDDWMHQLYGPDLPEPLDYAWIMDRVRRCERRIWATASEVAEIGGDVVLDLGFMKVANRREFTDRARASALPVRLHFIDAPHDIRRRRVLARNSAKGETFSFEVTPAMFDFMERQFQQPTTAELSTATVVSSGEEPPSVDVS